MQPDYNLRIRSMSKAILETVIPAIDPNNRSALEQAHIVLGSLELLRQQVEYAHPFEIADINALADLARSLAAENEIGLRSEAERVIKEALTRSERVGTSISSLKKIGGEIRMLISRLIEAIYADSGDEKADRVQAIVLAESKAQIARERAFTAAANFDVFPDDLQSIEATLAIAASPTV